MSKIKIPVLVAFLAIIVSQSWAENCQHQGQQAYCQWPSSCSLINNNYSDGGQNCTTSPNAVGCEPCATKIEHCSNAGKLFVGGAISGNTCTGTQVGGKMGLKGCCRWAQTQTLPERCYSIYESDTDYLTQISDCSNPNSPNEWMPGVQCIDDAAGTCPTDADGSSSSSAEYCKWADTEGGCPNDCCPLTNPEAIEDAKNPGKTNREICIAFSQGLFNNSTCSGTPIAGGPDAPKPNQCKDSQGRGLFCGWTSGCYRIETDAEVTTCTAALEACPDANKYFGVSQAALDEDDDGGGDLVCSDLGGTLWTPPPLTPSSSSGGDSKTEYAYCVITAAQICTKGPHTSTATCPSPAFLSNDCQYGSNTSSDSKGENLQAGQFAYCVMTDSKICTKGPFTACQGGGLPSNDCPSAYTTTPVIMVSKMAGANRAQAIKNGVSLQVTNNATMEIFGLNGKSMRKLQFTNGTWAVPLSDMPKGLYIVKVSYGSSREILRLPVN